MSISSPTNRPNHPVYDWRKDGLRYYSYRYYLKNRYGVRVQRVSIDAGFTCPNVDGTVAFGGCTFCDNRSFSPSRRQPKFSVTEQIDDGISRLKRRYNCDHFTAYFQPATNTYAPVERLRAVYTEALAHPKIVAMSIGTRPDCVPDDVLSLLEEFAAKTELTVEYGMQTMHDKSLDWMNRGHHHDAMVEAMERSVGRGFEICAHIMLGLPGETREEMLATADEVARLGIDAVKMHNLYAVENTPLADQVRRGEVELMGRDEYVSTLVEFLERLPSHVVVERISGDSPDNYFIGPSWCLDKPMVLKAVEEEFEKRDTWQGKLFEQRLRGGTDKFN
ncbi:MAG: TIGR01212 family radical SAM protein [Pirellulaceae bacterium]